MWQQAGIHSVPAVVIDDRHLIQGGQPAEVFEQALRQIAAQRRLSVARNIEIKARIASVEALLPRARALADGDAGADRPGRHVLRACRTAA